MVNAYVTLKHGTAEQQQALSTLRKTCLQEAYTDAVENVATRRRLKEKMADGDKLNTLAQALVSQGRVIKTAYQLHDAGFRLVKPPRRPEGESESEVTKGELLAEARPVFEEALQEYIAVLRNKNHHKLHHAHAGLAWVAAEEAKYAEAVEKAREAESLCRSRFGTESFFTELCAGLLHTLWLDKVLHMCDRAALLKTKLAELPLWQITRFDQLAKWILACKIFLADRRLDRVDDLAVQFARELKLDETDSVIIQDMHQLHIAFMEEQNKQVGSKRLLPC